MKLFLKALLCGFIITSVLTLSGFSGACDDIRGEVFRLHIIANSDSPEDQQLKLKVRDGILEYADKLFSQCKNREEAVKTAEQHIDEISKYAEDLVKKYGYDYEVKAYVTNMSFNTRVYEDITLPAGRYDALRIVIGKGEGKNWWCVLYPSVCLSCSGADEMDGKVNEKEKEIITESDNYRVGFKIVEIFEWISSLFG